MNISDKLSKVNESFEVSKIDNGYMVEVRGRTHDDDWDGVKIYASTLAMVENLLDEWNGMERD
jgi:hypothetical protein